ncbi:MAG: iron ABC transporter permease [Synergistetes bacterium]|nr:iron ABC transporter permease [Synergistota bacterium]
MNTEAKEKRDFFFNLAVWLLIGSILLFVVYPLAYIFIEVFFPEGMPTLRLFGEILQRHYFIRGFINSVKVATVVASLSVVIGYLFGYTVTRVDITRRKRKIFDLLATLPILSPPFLLALSAVLLLGYNGLITKGLLGITDFSIYGFKGLVIVETIGLFPIAYLTIKGTLQSIDPSIEDAASSLGATRWYVFRKVTLPLSMTGVANAFLLTFSLSMADFGNPMLLAGSRFPVLSVQAYFQITAQFHIDKGAAVALLLLLPALAIFFIQQKIIHSRSYITVTGKPSSLHPQPHSKLAKGILVTLCIVVLGIVAVFYATVLWGGFTDIWMINHVFTFKHFAYIWEAGREYLFDTLILAGIATPISGIIGIFIAFLIIRTKLRTNKFMEMSTMLNFFLPGTVVGIGYMLAFNRYPLLLSGTAYIIILNFIFRYIPVGIRSGISILLQIDPSIEEAAMNLGANRMQTFRKITMPLISPAFFSGLVYTFERSLTAISAIVFLVSPSWYIFTVFILDELSIGRIENASAAVVILFIIITAFIWLAKFVTRKMGEIPTEIST